MRIVLDTNCLLMALPQKSHYRCLWDAFLCRKFALCYSTEILQEYEELLMRLSSPEIALYAIGTLLKSPNIVQITSYYRWNLIAADPDDNKFVDCALNAGADYIVTNDRHFDVLKSLAFPPIKVINIEEFRHILTHNPRLA